MFTAIEQMGTVGKNELDTERLMESKRNVNIL
jgi:hypothetical protein